MIVILNIFVVVISFFVIVNTGLVTFILIIKNINIIDPPKLSTITSTTLRHYYYRGIILLSFLNLFLLGTIDIVLSHQLSCLLLFLHHFDQLLKVTVAVVTFNVNIPIY